MSLKSLRLTMAVFATVGLLIPTANLPSASLHAEDARPVVASRPLAADVTLHQNALRGRYVTPQGGSIAGATVSVRQRGVETARTTTTADGQFTVSVGPGIYEVVVGTEQQTVRVWAADTAPPTARPVVTLVAGDAVRGQLAEIDFVGLTAVTFIAASAGIGIAKIRNKSN